MTTTTNVDKVKINLLSQDQYDSMIINPNELYFITDSDTRYVKASEVSDVGYTGNYEDIINTPTISTVGSTGEYSDILNTPTLSNVATSGSYTDLSNKPTISTVGSTGEYSDILNTPTIPVVDQTYNASSTNAQSGVAVASALSTLDSTIVHLSGDETITGNKTFTGQTTFNRNDNDIRLVNKYTNYTKGTAPSNTQWSGVKITDSTGIEIADFHCGISTSNTAIASIVIKDPGTGTDTSAIRLFYPADGTPYTEAPTPTNTTTTSGTQIATTGWVNTLGNNVVHLTGNETISGEKIFANNIRFSGTAQIYYNGTKGNSSLIRFLDNTDNAYGNGISIGGGGPVVVGGGESAATMEANVGSSSGDEKLFLCNDGVIDIYTNVQSGASSAKHFIFETDGTLTTDTSPNTSDNSTKVATTAFVKAQGYLTAHQSLSNYVTLNSAQTISGTKTFTASPTISGTSPNLILKNTGITKGTAPSSANTKDVIYIRDNASKNMGYIRTQYATDGTTFLYLNAVRSSSATDTTARGIRIAASTASVYQVTPGSDNDVYLGYTSFRWKQVYAGTTSISTSDERLKQQITDIPDEVLDAWGNVGFCQFKFNDAVEEKGENARFHTGLIAQRIKEVFEEADIDPFSYGLLCYDEWESEDAVYDEDGNLDTPAKEAGNRYSLRYEECLCMECAYQRRRADRLEEKLEKRLKKIEKLLEIDE